MHGVHARPKAPKKATALAGLEKTSTTAGTEACKQEIEAQPIIYVSYLRASSVLPLSPSLRSPKRGPHSGLGKRENQRTELLKLSPHFVA